MDRLRQLFKAERERQGYSKGDLARLCGYKNVSKGGSRIADFEQHGTVHKELLEKLAAILGIDDATIKELSDLDWQDYVTAWNKWADEPLPMQIVIRMMAAMYYPRKVPPDFNQEQAEQYAAELAREVKKRCCLIVSRRLSIWFDENGEIEKRTYAEPGGGPNWPVQWVP